MNRKRFVLLVLGVVLVAVLTAVVFELAKPDSSNVEISSDGQTWVVYNTDADRDRAEQLATWSWVAEGLVVLVAAGLVVHGTRPGKWLRIEGPSTTTPPTDAPGGGR
jgi:hypothetical protein